MVRAMKRQRKLDCTDGIEPGIEILRAPQTDFAASVSPTLFGGLSALWLLPGPLAADVSGAGSLPPIYAPCRRMFDGILPGLDGDRSIDDGRRLRSNRFERSNRDRSLSITQPRHALCLLAPASKGMAGLPRGEARHPRRPCATLLVRTAFLRCSQRRTSAMNAAIFSAFIVLPPATEQRLFKSTVRSSTVWVAGRPTLSSARFCRSRRPTPRRSAAMPSATTSSASRSGSA